MYKIVRKSSIDGLLEQEKINKENKERRVRK